MWAVDFATLVASTQRPTLIMQPSLGFALAARLGSSASHLPNLRKPSLPSILITSAWTNACFSLGDRRLRLPEPLPPYEGGYEVHRFGPSCPQQRMVIPQGLGIRLEKDVADFIARMYENVTVDNEDCKSSGIPYVLR